MLPRTQLFSALAPGHSPSRWCVALSLACQAHGSQEASLVATSRPPSRAWGRVGGTGLCGVGRCAAGSLSWEPGIPPESGLGSGLEGPGVIWWGCPT